MCGNNKTFIFPPTTYVCVIIHAIARAFTNTKMFAFYDPCTAFYSQYSRLPKVKRWHFNHQHRPPIYAAHNMFRLMPPYAVKLKYINRMYIYTSIPYV